MKIPATVSLGLWAILASGLSACTVPASDGDLPPQPPQADGCDASRVQDRIGKLFTADVLAEAKLVAGASSARLLEPGKAYTMEFVPDRLSMEIDEKQKVIKVYCG